MARATVQACYRRRARDSAFGPRQPDRGVTITAFINGRNTSRCRTRILGGLAGLPYDNLGDPRNVDFTAVAFGIQTPFTVPTAATPKGACCVGTICSIKTEVQCTAASGTYRGDNTNCDGNPCNSTPQGRCCLDDGYSGQCLIREQAQCTRSAAHGAGPARPARVAPACCYRGACCIVD